MPFIDAGKNLDNEKALKQNKFCRLQKEIDEVVYDLYSIHPYDRRLIEEELGQTVKREKELGTEPKDNGSEEKTISESLPEHLHELLVWCVGIVFGRWDVRMVSNRLLIPKLVGPFDPLPVCSPGTLLSPDGFPATSGQIASEEWLKSRENVLDVPKDVTNPTISDNDYPIAIDWDGILVDDESHSDDIITRIREVWELLYGELSEEREQEVLGILGVKSLRDYFIQPRSFSRFHINRYTKSRRKAPIYWLLQSSKKNYSLLLYYHRLDKDIYYKALVNYVEPKVRLEENHLEQLRAQKEGTAGRELKHLEKKIENQESFVQELYDFRDKLKKVTELDLKPDLNDGVVLNIAPLWELVPWKEAKKYWDELMKGKYEWSTVSKQLKEQGVI